ncbi:MAG: elongation factor G [Myxococcota bacterium]|nr:elongation factor G [Myxococcota bacterium]
MQNVQVEHTRNFAIVGHSGDGKTSLGEAILHKAGETPNLGKVEDGTSVLNFLPEERTGHHTASVTSHVYAFDSDGFHLTLVDTPGDPNYCGDGEVALQALDGAILVLDAVEGVKSGTQRSLADIQRLELAVICFINGLDRERSDVDAALASLESMDVKPVLLAMPIGSQASLSGVVDLVHMKAVSADGKESEIPAELRDEADSRREQLVESVAECDDALIERYLEDGELDDAEVLSGLASGIRSRDILPVLCGSAITEVGVDLVLREIKEIFPSPEARGPWEASSLDGEEKVIAEPSLDAPFSAVVFKTIYDRYAGTLSVLRVASGKLTHDTAILNATRGKKTRVGKLMILKGEEHEDVPMAGPGDVVAVAKLKDVHTGDALTAEKKGMRLPDLQKPQGVLSYAVESGDKADEDKVFSSLARLAEEDPALHIGREPSTGEFLLTGMGELHIRTTAARLKRMFNVEIKLNKQKVPYRETVTKRVENVEGKLKKQTGGAGMFGVCYLNVEPMPRSEGFEFVDGISQGKIPRNLIPAVEKGVIEACVAGPLAGYPVVDIRVECVDGKYHDVDSNEMAFKLAGSFGLKAAVEKAKPVLLEPYMNVEVTVPDENVGDIMGDISSRRGIVQTTEARGHAAVVIATVPMAEMLEYATTLTSITGGKGEFHMRFSHYDQVGGKLAEKIIESARAA